MIRIQDSDTANEIIKKVWFSGKDKANFSGSIYYRIPFSREINFNEAVTEIPINLKEDYVEYKLERFVCDVVDNPNFVIKGYRTIGLYEDTSLVVDEWMDVVSK